MRRQPHNAVSWTTWLQADLVKKWLSAHLLEVVGQVDGEIFVLPGVA